MLLSPCSAQQAEVNRLCPQMHSALENRRARLRERETVCILLMTGGVEAFRSNGIALSPLVQCDC